MVGVSILHHAYKPKHVTGKLKQLRKYQSEAIASALNGLDKGNKKTLLVLATGLGKTVIATKLSESFPRTLFIVDREELLEQAALTFLAEKFDKEFVSHVKQIGFLNYVKKPHYWAGKPFKMGCIKADVFEPDGDVIVASVQTLHRRLDKINSDSFPLVIIDEAHKFMAETYFKAINHFNPKLRLGLSATPYRSDGLPLGDLFDTIDFEYNIREGIRDGYLVELDAIRIKTNVSLDNVRTTAGELNQKDLSNEVNTLARNNLVADSYIKYLSGRKTIMFCCDIQHALDMAETFLSKGIKSTAVSSDEKLTGDRSEKIKRFKAGEYDVICNVDILTTGFDDPYVQGIIQGCPTKSKVKYLQGIGRGTRTLPGVIDGIETAEERWSAIKSSDKKDCLVLDIVDNTNRHNIINSWTLDRELDPEDRVFISQEKRDKLLAERERKRNAKIEHTQKEDERVGLLKLPRVKLSKSIKMQDPATEAQLKWIYDLGYPKDVHYTKQQCNEIISQLPAPKKDVEELVKLGYDISGRVITRGDVNAVKWEIQKKLQKK